MLDSSIKHWWVSTLSLLHEPLDAEVEGDGYRSQWYRPIMYTNEFGFPFCFLAIGTC